MTFSYHRRLAPMIGVLLGLALVEALVLHLVAMAWWGWRVAAPLLLLDGGVVLLLGWFLRTLRWRPIALDERLLTLHTGSRLRLTVPLESVAGFRDGWTAGDLKEPGLLNMALIAWPTVVIDLDPPVRGRWRSIRAVAHCIDEPERFRAAVTRAAARVHPPA